MTARKHIEQRIDEGYEEQYEVIVYTRKYLATMHPDELKRCKETIFALTDERAALWQQWNAEVFGA